MSLRGVIGSTEVEAMRKSSKGDPGKGRERGGLASKTQQKKSEGDVKAGTVLRMNDRDRSGMQDWDLNEMHPEESAHLGTATFVQRRNARLDLLGTSRESCGEDEGSAAVDVMVNIGLISLAFSDRIGC